MLAKTIKIICECKLVKAALAAIVGYQRRFSSGHPNSKTLIRLI